MKKILVYAATLLLTAPWPLIAGADPPDMTDTKAGYRQFIVESEHSTWRPLLQNSRFTGVPSLQAIPLLAESAWVTLGDDAHIRNSNDWLLTEHQAIRGQEIPQEADGGNHGTDPSQVPEPSTLLLLGIGLAGISRCRLRRRAFREGSLVRSSKA